MVLDGFLGIRKSRLQLRASVGFRGKMINDRRLLAIVDSQKVFSIQLGEGIGAQSHVFRESQDVHLTPQNRMRKGRRNDYYPRASGHHWRTLSEITPKDNHFTAKGRIWAPHDVAQNPVYRLGTVSMLCWSFIPNDQLCFLE